MELNFMGVAVADWSAAYRFYTDVLGIQTASLQAAFGDWAALGGGWDAYYQQNSRSMIFELFDQGRPFAGKRFWGHGQGIRPSIQVTDLAAVVAACRQRGVPFSSAIETMSWGRRIELTTPEAIRWTLSEAPGHPANPGLSVPYIGHAEIKAHDFPGQIRFYCDLMGLRVTSQTDSQAILEQGAGLPWLVLEPGGEAQANDPAWAFNPTRGHPVFLSFMTPDIQPDADRLKAAGVTVLQDMERHDDWGGTDLIVTDADGNALQIVQYG